VQPQPTGREYSVQDKEHEYTAECKRVFCTTGGANRVNITVSLHWGTSVGSKVQYPVHSFFTLIPGPYAQAYASLMRPSGRGRLDRTELGKGL